MNAKKNLQKNRKKVFSKETGILPQIANVERYKLIGEITSLMLASNVHRRYLIDDIGAMFLPAIHLNQFRIYKNKNGDPVGLITWAFLSNEIEEQFQKGKRNLKLDDWKSGNNGWVIDFIAPFGHTKQIIKDLRDNIFPDKQGKALRINNDGTIRGIWQFHGSDFLKSVKKAS